MRSSSSLHGPFFIFGSRWLNHRSRHCFPIRPSMRSAISLHLEIPALTHRMIVSSSSVVHGPLTRPGCREIFVFDRCKSQPRLIRGVEMQICQINSEQTRLRRALPVHFASTHAENLLPSVQALYIAPRSLEVIDRNRLPILSADLFHCISKQLVFLLCPPSSTTVIVIPGSVFPDNG